MKKHTNKEIVGKIFRKAKLSEITFFYFSIFILKQIFKGFKKIDFNKI
jgi:hypothetical protein